MDEYKMNVWQAVLMLLGKSAVLFLQQEHIIRGKHSKIFRCFLVSEIPVGFRFLYLSFSLCISIQADVCNNSLAEFGGKSIITF